MMISAVDSYTNIISQLSIFDSESNVKKKKKKLPGGRAHSVPGLLTRTSDFDTDENGV